jgi:SnoaL-like protein
MSLHLPKPIELYFKAENAGRPDDLTACIATDATVFDERRTYHGLAAIKAWKAETKAKYNHTVEPLELEERDGRLIVKSRLAGTFPGSPIVIEFAFELEGDKIKSLTIG